MRQVLQFIDSGTTLVRDVPVRLCGPREVLIANAASLVSSGTEKALVQLAKKSILGKARERPDDVRRVLQKLTQEGILETVRQVRARLGEPLPLGYSSAGVVVEVGCEVNRFRPGDRVASNGAHAEFVAVPQNLVARIPEGVSFEEACYAAVGAVALQGIRLARVSLGERVGVIGLGLVGQIVVMLLRAAGCTAIGTDLDESRRRMAADAGCEVASLETFLAAVQHTSDGQGADAVIVTASSSGDEPLRLAAAAARKKARIIVIGAVGMEVPRRDFYAKELELVVSCSYGPGRYDRDYEERGRDYPYAYVRWTEQRNLAAVLEQIARKRLDVRRLTTHRVGIEEAARAYKLIETGEEPYLGIVLDYPADAGSRAIERHTELPRGRSPGKGNRDVSVALIGAGNFASLVLAPALRRARGVRLHVICSAGGVRSTVVGERHGFRLASTSIEEVLCDGEVDAVFVATPHNLHADQALAALQAGKAVFVEKPLAITTEQLERFQRGLLELGARQPVWTVGFNRRFSAAARIVADFFSEVATPIALAYRFNAGPVAHDHWIHDPEVGGGRLVGEACHALDLASFLLRGQVVRIFAEPVAAGSVAGAGNDQATLVARFNNGSVASVGYFTGGDKGFPKERIELFGGGRVAIIDDFRTVALSMNGRCRRRRFFRRDKGHRAQIGAFVAGVRSGQAPIPYSALLNVSWAIVAATESLKTGLPAAVPLF